MNAIETHGRLRTQPGRTRAQTLCLALLFAACSPSQDSARPAASDTLGSALDLLILNGRVLDGAGNPWILQDVGVAGDQITFLGDATAEALTARDTVDATGLLVTPGLWDAHSHAERDTPEGRVRRRFYTRVLPPSYSVWTAAAPTRSTPCSPATSAMALE